MNIGLLIEYDGTDFHGWQRQQESPTIQALIEDNLSDVAGTKIVLYGASRTDSGVHAEAQVANFYVSSGIDPERWRSILNFRLPRTIRILCSQRMQDEFHAQKLAVSKVYEYRILNRDYSSALDRRVLFYPRPLLWYRIREAMPFLTGEKDFRAFQGAKAEVRTTVRTVYSFELYEDYQGLYRFRIEGSGFLKDRKSVV